MKTAFTLIIILGLHTCLYSQFTAAFWGDSRSNSGSAFKEITGYLRNEKGRTVDVHWQNGDFTEGGSSGDWDDSWDITNVRSACVKDYFFMCTSNHDDGSAYQGELGGILPSNGKNVYYYMKSWNIPGSSRRVHLLSFDLYMSGTSEQLNYFKPRLAKVDPDDWIVALWHAPSFDDMTYKDEEGEDGKDDFMEMLESAGGDLILNGHAHQYRRTHILDQRGNIAERTGGRNTSHTSPKDSRGMVHIVNGRGGVFSTSSSGSGWSGNAYAPSLDESYGLVTLLTFDDDKCKLRTIRIGSDYSERNQLESWTWTRPDKQVVTTTHELPYNENFSSLGGSFKCSKNTCSWTSGNIIIDGARDLVISADVRGDEYGRFENADFLRMSYSVDGGSWKTIYSHTNDLRPDNISKEISVNGKKLRIKLDARTSQTNEIYKVDNLIVKKGGGTENDLPYSENFSSLGGSFKCSKNTCSWTSGNINIDGARDLVISADVRGDEYGRFENADFLRMSYSVDDGSWNTFYSHTNDLRPENISKEISVNGKKLRIMLQAKTSQTNEVYKVDNLLVKKGGGTGNDLPYSENFSSLGGNFQCNRNTCRWTSVNVNISGGQDLVVSADVRGDDYGVFEDAEYLKMAYSVDGGSWVIFYSHINDLKPQTITKSVSARGSTIRIRIDAKTSGTYETYKVDDLLIKDGSSGSPKFSAGDMSSADTPNETGLKLRSLSPSGVEFILPEMGEYTLTVFTLTGNKYTSSGFAEAGLNLVPVKMDRLPQGIYYLRLQAGGRTITGKFSLMRMAD